MKKHGSFYWTYILKSEALLATRVANFMKLNYPEVIYRFDQIDQVGRRGGVRNKELHGKWSAGYPDLFIAHTTKKHGGLYLELKATKTVHNTEHTRRQGVFHTLLRKAGYKVKFVCGYDESIKQIKKYLRVL